MCPKRLIQIWKKTDFEKQKSKSIFAKLDLTVWKILFYTAIQNEKSGLTG